MKEIFYNLIDKQGEIPGDYLQDVGETKRVLERWTIDDEFRKMENIEDGLKLIKTPKTLLEILPFIDKKEGVELRKKESKNEDDSYPLSVRRYRHFIREKMAGRQDIRVGILPANQKYKYWRNRQINRCVGELGPIKADGLVHAPLAFELSKGCSVGCWFCAVSSQKLTKVWRYTDENAKLWKDTINILKETIGDCIKYGVCYWATEPFDCPDYEKFIEDFVLLTGRCPQTTTAIPDRDIERTRKFLKLMDKLNGGINRFSIRSKEALFKVHTNFTAQELTYVELIPQNLEASSQYKKAYAGKAREVKLFSNNSKLNDNVQKEEYASTIACISGFVINMTEKSIELITPCPASIDWPLGYWSLDKQHFENAQELSVVLNSMIDNHMNSSLPLLNILKLRKDLTWSNCADNESVEILSKYLSIKFDRLIFTNKMLELISESKHTAFEIAIILEDIYKIELSLIMLQMNEFYEKGLFDEEPLKLSK